MATFNTAPDPGSMDAGATMTPDAAPATTMQSVPETPWYKLLPHPATTVFTLLFKVIALLVYMLLYWLSSGQFVVTFVLVLLCIAFDFWIMKNLSGRMLVGLRWWNEVSEDGSSRWRFECLPDKDKGKLNQVEILIFWGSLFIFPLIWIGCFLLAVLRLPPQVDWAVLVVIAFIISTANLLGYVKCARGARAQVRKMVTQAATKAVVAAATASLNSQ